MWRWRVWEVLTGHKGADTFLLAFGRGVQLASGLALTLILAWNFGLSGTGVYTLASAPAALSAMLVGFGLSSAMSRQTLSQSEKATAGMLVSGLWIPPTIMTAGLAAVLLSNSSVEFVAVWAIGSSGAFLGLANVQQAAAIVQRRVPLATVPPIVQLFGIGFVAATSSLEQAAIVILVSRGVSSVLGLALLQHSIVSISVIVVCLLIWRDLLCLM